jgi:hypothetical protein
VTAARPRASSISDFGLSGTGKAITRYNAVKCCSATVRRFSLKIAQYDHLHKAELGIEIDRFKVSLEDLTNPSAIRKRPTNRAFRSFLTREKVCPLTGKRMVHSNTANGF